MRSTSHWGAENWADLLPTVLGFKRPPIDLYAVARHRRIRHLGFRFMIPRGVLLPVEGGFEVYLRDQTRKDVDVSQEEPGDALSPRQRFSLAHEIAHTRFYKLSESIPSSDGTISNGFELEDICNRAAGCILVPTDLLKREVREYGKEIDADFIRLVASKFRTSLTVALERLSLAEPSNPFGRCILLARKTGDAEIPPCTSGSDYSLSFHGQENTRAYPSGLDFPRRALDQRCSNG